MENQQIKNFIERARSGGASDDEIVSYLKNKGVNFETGKIEQTQESNFLDKAKSAVMGFAGGVGGIALAGEDYLARSGILGERVKKAMEGQQKLQEQFKQEFSCGNEGAYDIGRFGGEIAALATPVGAVGKATNIATKSALTGTTKLAPKTIETVGKVAQAGSEGLAFTKGIELIEGEKQSLGDYALNAGLNMAFPVGGLALKKAGEYLPSRIINSLIKPLQKDFAYGKNPGKVVSEMGITANNFEELISKIKETKQKVGQTIGVLREKSSVPMYIEPTSILSPIDEAIVQASKTPKTNSALIERLSGLRDDLAQNIDNGISPEEMKSLVGDLTKWTGNATDDQLVNKALKNTYGVINSQMDDALKQGLSSEEFNAYKKLNEQYGDLISAENASIYRDKILQRQDLISFGAKNAGLLTALTTAVATGGVGIGTVLAGLGGAVVDKAMATPAFKTRLASVLSKLAPKEVKTFFDKVPTAKEIFSEQQIKSYIENPKMGLSIEDVSKKGKGTIPENSLIQESKGSRAMIANYGEDLGKEMFSLKSPITVYRGEGKGIGNSTLVKGRYFADSEKFASNFGNVSKTEIPKGTNILDLDNLKTGNGAIPQELLVDQNALTDYLLDRGIKWTKNTNSRGVEFVELKRNPKSILEKYAKNTKSFEEFVTKSGKGKDFSEALDKFMNEGIANTGAAYDSRFDSLKQIWKKANKN